MAMAEQMSKLVQDLRTATAGKALSHAIILTGTGDRVSAARYIAAAHVCQANQGCPCLTCSACHKVLNDIHPDVSFIHEDEKKELSVEDIRDLRQDVYVLPNEAKAKVYIFTDCEQLNERDQNVLLKIVEEGPPYASFVFLSETSSRLLATIQSRCVEMKIRADDVSQDQPHALSEPFFRALCSGQLPITSFLVEMENKRMKREDLAAFFRQSYPISAEALLRKAGKVGEAPGETVSLLMKNFNQRQLNELTEILRYFHHECDYNVGVAHVIGALNAKLMDFLNKL